MRIAIYHNLPSGGGKRALYEMTRRLAARHEVNVYTLSSADRDFCDLRPYCGERFIFPFEPLPLVNSPFGRLNQGIRAIDLLRLRGLERRIAEQIDRAGYDVIFVHNCRYGQSPSILSFLETPSAYYCQEPPRQLYEPPVPRPYNAMSRAQRLRNLVDPFPGLYRRTLKRHDRANVQAADAVLVNSAYARETLYRVYGIFAWVCYLGVDAAQFRPLGLDEGDFVLSVGMLNPRKGFDFLIRSLTEIGCERRPRLVIVSNAVDDRERGYLAELAESLGVQVVFRVRVSDEELVQLYNRAELTLYAPIMEPFGFVPLESMACGTPVVGVREGGVRESVLDGVTGLLTDRDPKSFAGLVKELLRDCARRQRLGIQGKVYVEEMWSWHRSMERLETSLARARDLSGQVH